MAYKTVLTIGNDQRHLLDFRKHYFKMENWTFCEWNEQNRFGTLHELTTVSRNNPYTFRPIGEPFGGTFHVSFESTDKDDSFYHWFKTTEATHGTIEFYNGSEEDLPFKRIEFWDAWISDISEEFSSIGSKPMILHCCISPATVRINKSLVFQKNWWITDINQKEVKEEEKTELFVSEIKWRGSRLNKDRKDIMLNHEIELEVLTKDFYNGESFELTVKQSKGRRIKGSSSEFTVKGTAKEDGTALIPVKVECDFKEDNQDFEDIIFYHKEREVARFKENFGWTYVKEGGMTKIFVNAETSFSFMAKGCTEDDCKEAINDCFKRVLQNSSSGKVSGKIFFKGISTTFAPQVVPSLNIIKDDGGRIEGINMFSGVVSKMQPVDDSALLLNLAETTVHELLHSLRIPHPFERIVSEDTDLIREKDGSYQTTSKTDPNIQYNIMIYSSTIINNKLCGDLWRDKRPEYITKGQLDLVIREIDAQKKGAGSMLTDSKSEIINFYGTEMEVSQYDAYWNFNPPGIEIE